MNRFVFSSASVKASISGVVGVGVITGVVTPGNAAGIIASSAQWGGGKPLANVAIYDPATVAISMDQLLAAASSVRWAADNIVTPVALVATGDQAAMFMEYARRCGERGVLRAVFDRPCEALTWAARQALVQEHYLRQRARLLTT